MSVNPREDDQLLLDDEGLFARDIDGQLVRLDPATAADFEKDVTVTIDGREITVKKAVPATDAQGHILRDAQGIPVPRATTIYDAARALYGDRNPIPILCHQQHMDPVAVCRLCVVEISKVHRRTGKVRTERKLLPACQHRVEETMVVETVESPNEKARDRIKSSVGLLVDMLMADHPSPCAREKRTQDCELEGLARRFGVGGERFPKTQTRGRDNSSLVIAVDHNACVLCDRCIRGCNAIRNNEVIGRMGKGYEARIAFDLDAPMGRSTCVACGECSVSCPTGALMTRDVVEADPWKGLDPPAEPVDPGELFDHPIVEIRRAFEEMSPKFLHWNSRAVVRRRYRKGEILCREGEYGSTAFFVESGKVDIYIASTIKHAEERARTSGLGLVKRFATSLLSRGESARPGEGKRADIPVEGISLPYDKPRATLGPGTLLGEMTCLSFYPRSATVRAAEETTVLEMLRNVLYIMQRSKSYRTVLEARYRESAIGSHLASVPLFESLRADPDRFDRFVKELKPRVQLVRCDPGQVILRQDAPADDGFFLVRSGFVKITQRRPGGEVILSYVGPGGHFGEIGMMADLPELRAEGLQAGVRTATCSALDHVELVRISSADFRAILDNFPDEVRGPLVEEARKRLRQNRDAQQTTQTMPLADFLSQGLMNAQSLLVLDLEKCTRCDECSKACADAHDGVTRLVREGLRFDKFLVASSCRSCLDPYCMVGCPVGSIRRRASREIIIEDWCIGCGKCAENCPYGNINMHPFRKKGEYAIDPERPRVKIPVVQMKATTCDLCHELGPHAAPSCVYACPHDAAHRMTGRELKDLVERSQSM